MRIYRSGLFWFPLWFPPIRVSFSLFGIFAILVVYSIEVCIWMTVLAVALTWDMCAVPFAIYQASKRGA